MLGAAADERRSLACASSSECPGAKRWFTLSDEAVGDDVPAATAVLRLRTVVTVR